MTSVTKELIINITEPVLSEHPILLYIRLTMKNLIGREHSINSQ